MERLIWADFEKDNEHDSAKGGRGNWKRVEIPDNVPEEQWADYLSEKTGWLVADFVTVEDRG